MGKAIEVKLNKFNGGIEDDPRDPREDTCRMVTNFDIVTNPYRMIPYRNSEQGDDSSSSSRKRNFTLALRTGTTYSLYALGVKSGATTAEVLYKDLTTGAVNDLDDDDWANTSNNQSSAGATNYNLFLYYEQTGLIYGMRAGTHIWAYDPAGSTAWDDTEVVLINFSDFPAGGTPYEAHGVIHSQDDIMYVGVHSMIIKNNAGTWTSSPTPALQLPLDLYVTAMCEFGNYLAIALAPKAGFGNARVILWDRDSSLTTVSENIDAGEGVIKVLEEIDGVLTAVMLSGNSTNRFKSKVTIKGYNGAGFIKLKELNGSSATVELNHAKQKLNNRLYFMMSIEIDGTVRDGIWSIGRIDGRWVLAHERTPDNNTALTATRALYGFIFYGDYWFQAFQSGSVFQVRKTNDSEVYPTAIYESKKFNGGDSGKGKKLLGITVTHEPLGADAQVVIKYKKDEETSFSSALVTNATDDSMRTSTVVDGSGNTLPRFKEIQFRIESSGAGSATAAATITGLKFRYEEVEDDVY